MKPLISLVPAVLFFIPALALADEPPHLEFVKALREKGYPDLALEYLKKLQANKPAGITDADLALETAMTGLEAGQLEPNSTKRIGIYNQARQDFEGFLKANPGNPRAPEATLALARIVYLQGKTQVSVARRQETPEAQKAERLKARALFEDAEKQLKAAADSIPESKPGRLEANFDVAMDILDEAFTYDEKDDPKQRSDLVLRAKNAFQDISKKASVQDEKSPLYWQARVWTGRCLQEIDQTKEALTEFTKIIGETGPEVEPAKRLAKYFRLLAINQRPDIALPPKSDPTAETIRSGEAWLQSYPNAFNTPEGLGIRNMVAEAYFQQGMKYPEKQRATSPAKEYFTKAEKLFEPLEETDSDYAGRARQALDFIILTLGKARTGGDITKLNSFEECFTAARAEIGAMNDDAKKWDDQINKLGEDDSKEKLIADKEKAHNQHLQKIVQLLTHGLRLAKAKTPAASRNDARFILAYAYLASGDPKKCVEVAEDLARSEREYRRAPDAAVYALQGYTQILGEEEGQLPNLPPKDPARDQVSSAIKADQGKLRSLASYMEATWPQDPATDFARHQLATLAMKDKNYPEAITILNRISDKYSAYTYSQFELANAAEFSQNQGLKPPQGQPSYADQAQAALVKIPDPLPSVESGTLQVYMFAKLKLFNILYVKKQFNEMQQLADKLAKTKELVDKVNLDQTVKDQITSSVASLPVYILVGQADAAFKSGKYDEVKKILEPEVKGVQDQTIPVKDPQFLRGMLGLYLRASVQLNDVNRAKEIIPLLEGTAGDLEKGGTTSILIEVVQQLKDQVKELEKKGPSAAKEKEAVVANFSAFLDELGKQKNLTPEQLRFLAFSYAGLGQHDKAADLIAKVPPPEPPMTEEKEANFHAVQMLHTRELRMAKKFEEAQQLLDQISQTKLGKKSLELKKEKIMLKEEKGDWVAAARDWNGMMKELQKGFGKVDTHHLKANPTDAEQAEINKEKRFEEEYYDCYFHFTYCYYQNALKRTDPKKKAEDIAKVADFIHRLETGQPDLWNESMKKRYEELFQKEQPLKEEFDKLKSAA